MRLIRFVPELPDKTKMLLEPSPVKNHIPEWYRLGESTYQESTGGYSPGMKSCAPFLDVMLTGYVLVTPFDIFVGIHEDGSLNIRWNGPSDWNSFIGERPKEVGATIPRPAGHHPNHLVWASKWGWKTPRGYSTIITHPYNRHDLPFTTLSGIIDSDKFVANGNLPFFMQEGFEGTIPAGTPYAQIIPFKRHQWKMVADYGLRGLAQDQGVTVRNPKTSYKKAMWVKKKYD